MHPLGLSAIQNSFRELISQKCFARTNHSCFCVFIAFLSFYLIFVVLHFSFYHLLLVFKIKNKTCESFLSVLSSFSHYSTISCYVLMLSLVLLLPSISGVKESKTPPHQSGRRAGEEGTTTLSKKVCKHHHSNGEGDGGKHRPSAHAKPKPIQKTKLPHQPHHATPHHQTTHHMPHEKYAIW